MDIPRSELSRLISGPFILFSYGRIIVAHRLALALSEQIFVPRATTPSRRSRMTCHRRASRKPRPHVQRLYNSVPLPHTTP